MPSKKKKSNQPPANQLVYSGPARPLAVIEQTQLVTKLMSLATVISSNGSGVINNTFGLQNPSSFSNWADMAGVYDEYRVLSATIKFIPSNGYNKVVATQSCANPIFVVLDRDSVTTLATQTAALAYDSVEMYDLERPFTYSKYKMNGAREATFITTAAPANLGAYAFFANNLTASLQYGTVLMQMLVQFRASA